MSEFFQFVVVQVRLTTKRFFEPLVWLSGSGAAPFRKFRKAS